MLVLRADPWMPEYGMGFDPQVEEVGRATDLELETDDWTNGIGGGPPPAGALWFVDGVRRPDLWVVADGERGRGAGLFGSFAVGAVRCDGRAEIARHAVRRFLVLGAGLDGEPVDLEELRYEVESVAASEREHMLHRLQALMQRDEARLVLQIGAEAGRLVIADGPLAYATYDVHTASPVVGVAKRSARPYLEGQHEALLGRLIPAQRTPVFAIADAEGRVRRYSWYVRLAPVRPPVHDRAALVRCEIREGVGRERAIRVAGETAAALPLYAGRPHDPRAPQNLAPVGALEAWLRHRLGDQRVVRRRLLEWLREGVAA